MIHLDERGITNPLLIPFILAVISVVGLGGFGTWSYLKYVDHRDNVQVKVNKAVEVAKDEQEEELEAEFAEREKEPLTVYNGPAALGSLVISHPKTWSVFVDETTANELEAFLHPIYVSAEGQDKADALRVTVDQKVYAEEVKRLQRDVDKGRLVATAITVSGVDGVRFDGEIEKDIFGALVVLPLRDKTLKIWTESPDYLNDFNSIILPNFVFSP